MLAPPAVVLVEGTIGCSRELVLLPACPSGRVVGALVVSSLFLPVKLRVPSWLTELPSSRRAGSCVISSKGATGPAGPLERTSRATDFGELLLAELLITVTEEDVPRWMVAGFSTNDAEVEVST